MIMDGRWGGAHVLLVPEVLGLRGLGDLEAHVVQVDALVLDVLAALGHVCLRARSAPSPGSMTADAGRGAGKGRRGAPFLVTTRRGGEASPFFSNFCAAKFGCACLTSRRTGESTFEVHVL